MTTAATPTRSASRRDEHQAAVEQAEARLGRRLTYAERAVDIVGLDRDLRAVGQQAVARAIAKVPGALDVASRIVSSAAFAGIGDVYDANAGLFDAFMYSAVMDAATCDPCAELDGESFESWDAIQEVLP